MKARLLYETIDDDARPTERLTCEFTVEEVASDDEALYSLLRNLLQSVELDQIGVLAGLVDALADPDRSAEERKFANAAMAFEKFLVKKQEEANDG